MHFKFFFSRCTVFLLDTMKWIRYHFSIQFCEFLEFLTAYCKSMASFSNVRSLVAFPFPDHWWRIQINLLLILVPTEVHCQYFSTFYRVSFYFPTFIHLPVDKGSFSLILCLCKVGFFCIPSACNLVKGFLEIQEHYSRCPCYNSSRPGR